MRAVPGEVVALPVVSQGKLLAVIEIATFAPFPPGRMRFDQLLPATAMSIEVLTRNIHTAELLKQTQQQAVELKVAMSKAAEAANRRRANSWPT